MPGRGRCSSIRTNWGGKGMAVDEVERLVNSRDEQQAVQQSFTVERHESPSLEALNALLEALPGGAVHSPFQAPLFLRAFARHMLERVSGRFFVLEVRDTAQGVPVLLLPVIIRRRGPIRIASMPDLGLADQSAPILARSAAIPEYAQQEVCALLLGKVKDADLFDFYNMPEQVEGRDNPLARHAAAVPTTASLILDLSSSDLESDWRKKEVFKQAPRKARRLAEQGVEFFEATDPEERLKVYDILVEQRRVRFEEIGLANGLEQPDQYAFYREIASRPYPESPAVILGLKADDEIVAANLFMKAGTIFNTVLLSIGERRWHRLSPGIVLMAKALEWAKSRGVEQYSFGTGTQDYKKRFGAKRLPMRNLTLPITPLGTGYKAIRDAKDKFKQFRSKQAVETI